MSNLITIKEAAQILGVTTTTLKRWEKLNKITPIKTMGGHRRYKKEELLKLINVNLFNAE